MNKTKLFVDVDGVIIDSIKAYCSSYNELYKDHPEFKPALWYECEEWDFKDVAPLVNNCNEIFSSPLFFKYAEFINNNTKEVIEELCNKYIVTVCTIGTHDNIALKSLWLKDNLPCVKNHIFIVNDGCKMDKSCIDMSNSIFIDDVVSNLDSSNATYKIIFGDEYKWNKTDRYLRCFNWTDVHKILI